ERGTCGTLEDCVENAAGEEALCEVV
ncbi:hypothetical protein A2U01_0087248, partial [Trifolium medium]|nr:hypothetical protein [Trifolium medium]